MSVSVIFVLGGPGAGKGTQCSALAAKHGFAHYSAGDLLRAEVASGSEAGNQIKDMLKNGEIVPSEVTIGLLKNAIETTPDCEVFLIDGFPRNIYQGEKFEEEVTACKGVVFLDADQAVMEERLLTRAEQARAAGAPVRTDDNKESMKKRFKTHYDTCMPVVEHYKAKGKVHPVGAEKCKDEVTADVEAVLTKLNIL